MNDTAKRWLKSILPPLITDSVRKLKAHRNRPHIWEGIYSHIRDVPVENASSDSEARIREFVALAQSLRLEISAGKKPPFGYYEPLGILAAAVWAKQRQIRVLDYGGCVGLGLLELLKTLPDNAIIQYHVVDLDKTCEAGRKLFFDDSRIKFYSSLPDISGQIDIVYASSVLPYIEDYPGLLKKLAAFGAPYILLTQLAAGSFPTYAARQLNLSGQVLAYWFLNSEEIKNILARSGYVWIYKTETGREYDQSNYPEEYRLGRMKTMLFARSE